MSILRIVTNPADIGAGGYVWDTDETRAYDNTRVDGAFRTGDEKVLSVPHEAPSGTEVWYHWRHAQTENSNIFHDGNFVVVQDSNSNNLAALSVLNSELRLVVIGDTTTETGQQRIGTYTPYSMDLHVIVSSTITARWYINGALYGEATVQNTENRGVGRNITWAHTYNNADALTSEIIIADEDTRGMRVREMRPKSFGIFQEWDGSIQALRDTDLATGISTDTADRRVSFGVTNIENVKAGDVVNRVVAQAYAQKGETGLSAFNFFFRHRDGTVTDGSDQTLTVLGDYFSEEYLTNPLTGLSWQPEDFASLQTGIQSKA